MRIYISGGAKNGKSGWAQELASALSKETDSPLYYVATMIPVDEEDRTRIRRHVADRDGMGFTTIEQGLDIEGVLDKGSAEGTYLLDSVTALMANELFREEGLDFDKVAIKTASSLIRLSRRVKNLILVSDGLYSDAMEYQDLTQRYRAALGRVQQLLAAECEWVAECCFGRVNLIKGDADSTEWAGLAEAARYADGKTGKTGKIGRMGGMGGKADESREFKELIIGGASQGKTEYARARYGFKDEDIFVCGEDEAEIDPSKVCIAHLERYVLSCLKQGREISFSPGEDMVVICDDISCGIVPMEALHRLWREETGRLVCSLAGKARQVTRVFAGIPAPVK